MLYLEFLIKLIGLSKNWIGITYSRYISKKAFSIYMRDGTKFNVAGGNKADISMMIEVYGLEFYNPPLFEINDTDIVFDIWTHVWYFSLYAIAKAKNGKVFSFEPLPENFNQFKKHIEINNRTNIHAFNVAIGWNDWDVDFYVFEGHNGCHSLYERQEWQKVIKIPKKSLETVLLENNIWTIDFLKMDCEWAEYEILFNASEAVLNKIKKISMELHNDIVDWMDQNVMLKFLNEKWFIATYNKGYIYALNKYYL